MRKVVLSVMLLLLFMSNATKIFCGTFGIEEKIALENSIAKRIEEVVARITGDRNMVVIVNVEHNPTVFQEVTKVGVSAAKPASSVNKNNYLPGIPLDALENEIVPPSDSSFSQTMKLPEFVKQVSITVILDNDVPDETLKNVREYLSTLVQFDSMRGDRLEIKKMSFAENKKEKVNMWRNMIVTQMPWLIGLFLIAFFIFGPLRSFMGNLVSAIEIFRVQADTRIISRSETGLKGRGSAAHMMDVDGEENSILIGHGGINELSAGTNTHFAFINESNINSLLFLLKNESPDTIAVVLAFLSKEFSAIVISSLPAELRKETLKKMAMVKQYHSEDIRVIEEHLKERVDYLLGGPQNIADIINFYDKNERERVLLDIGKEDPATEAAIRGVMVTVDDIIKLSKEHLYEVYKAIGTRKFAAALKGMGEEIKSYMMDNLTEGARDMLVQEIELIPKDISESRINQVKKDILIAMRRLEEQGVIRVPRQVSSIIGGTSAGQYRQS